VLKKMPGSGNCAITLDIRSSCTSLNIRKTASFCFQEVQEMLCSVADPDLNLSRISIKVEAGLGSAKSKI
jgi:hypothetical protein